MKQERNTDGLDYRKILDKVLTEIYMVSEEMKSDLNGLADDHDLLFDVLDPLQRLDMLLEFACILAPKIKEEISINSIHDAITKINSCADEEWEEERYGPNGARGTHFLAEEVDTLSEAIAYPISKADLFDAIYAENEFDPKDSGRCEFYMQILDIR